MFVAYCCPVGALFWTKGTWAMEQSTILTEAGLGATFGFQN